LRHRRWAIGLAFFASSCFFLSFTLGVRSWVSFVAGASNLLFGVLLFNQTFRVVIEPREEDRPFEPWEWRP
jgi:hypothetical protein